VVTNQSGIARGLFEEADLARVRAHLAAEAGAHGAALDGFYYCPHLPDGRGAYAIDCDCRKPAPGLLHRAARELSIDLAASWLVGDTWMDVAAGRSAGCRTIMVGPEHGGAPDLPPEYRPDHAAPGLREAAAIILGQTGAEEPAVATEPAA
jgi:histidinol-phosphate phosphatase family protein